MSFAGKLFATENTKAYKIAEMQSQYNYEAEVVKGATIATGMIASTAIGGGIWLIGRGVGRIVNHFMPPKQITLTVVPKKERLKKLDEEA